MSNPNSANFVEISFEDSLLMQKIKEFIYENKHLFN